MNRRIDESHINHASATQEQRQRNTLCEMESK